MAAKSYTGTVAEGVTHDGIKAGGSLRCDEPTARRLMRAGIIEADWHTLEATFNPPPKVIKKEQRK